jgi:GxxExxY protein
MPTPVNVLTREIISSAIEVHRKLGPGLLESAYQKCLARELVLRRVALKYEWPLPLEYEGVSLECGYRVDLLVADSVVVETKSIEAIAPIHEAQLLTYLRLGGWKVGLLLTLMLCYLRMAFAAEYWAWRNSASISAQPPRTLRLAG